MYVSCNNLHSCCACISVCHVIRLLSAAVNGCLVRTVESVESVSVCSFLPVIRRACILTHTCTPFVTPIAMLSQQRQKHFFYVTASMTSNDKRSKPYSKLHTDLSVILSSVLCIVQAAVLLLLQCVVCMLVLE
jgi:hypothetical protein